MTAAEKFASEAEMCSAFIAALPKGWTAYPEWGGFDILLVGPGGCQIGIEAKLALNAKVLDQILEGSSVYQVCTSGPDFRAVLVPGYATGGLRAVTGRLGITVLAISPYERGESGWFYPLGGQRIGSQQPYRPRLPAKDDYGWRDDWYDCCPWERITLPEVIPDNGAGCSAPIRLTEWKIKAIKIAIIIDQRGYVTRHDFKALSISMSRWTEGRWLAAGDRRGHWVAGRNMPDFRLQHPTNYAEIEALAEQWMPPAVVVPTQESLFGEISA